MTNLDDMVQSIQRSFRKLRQRKSWKKRVVGGAFVIEITKPGSKWHAHIHAVIAGCYFPFKELLNEWENVSTGRGVYIQMIPPGAIVPYLTKYITKPAGSINDFDQYVVSDTLRGSRLFQPFGTWHGYAKDFKKVHPACRECGSREGFWSSWDLGPPDFHDNRPFITPLEMEKTYVDPF